MSPEQPPPQHVSIVHELPNAEYPIEIASSGKAQLKDGVFEEPVSPGAATTTTIRLGKELAVGDVNGDGVEDAAVTLVVQSGGSGVFTFLALVLNDNGTAKPVTSILIGDRIVVKSLAIQPGTVVVTMLTRKPNEPMSAAPTVEVRRTFTFRGGKLVEEKPDPPGGIESTCRQCDMSVGTVMVWRISRVDPPSTISRILE
jgi:hypothetical protein